MKRKRDIFSTPGENGFVEPSTPGGVATQPASGNPFDIIQPVARPVDGASLFNPISAVLLLDAVKKPTRLLSARKSDRLSPRIAVPTPAPVVPAPAGIQFLMSDGFDSVTPGSPANMSARVWDNSLGGTLSGITHTNAQILSHWSTAGQIYTGAHNALTNNTFNCGMAGVANNGDKVGFSTDIFMAYSNSFSKIYPRYVDSGTYIEVQIDSNLKPFLKAYISSVSKHNARIDGFVGVVTEDDWNTLTTWVEDTDTGVLVHVTLNGETVSVAIANTDLRVTEIATPASTGALMNVGRAGSEWVTSMAIIQYG